MWQRWLLIESVPEKLLLKKNSIMMAVLAYYLNGRHMMLIDDEADYLARYLSYDAG